MALTTTGATPLCNAATSSTTASATSATTAAAAPSATAAAAAAPTAAADTSTSATTPTTTPTPSTTATTTSTAPATPTSAPAPLGPASVAAPARGRRSTDRLETTEQRGQLRLAYVATWANTADVFTKALPPACFAFLDWSCDQIASFPFAPAGNPVMKSIVTCCQARTGGIGCNCPAGRFRDDFMSWQVGHDATCRCTSVNISGQ
ncbi:unnamed protein product [Closterium sp. NIES-53]